MNKRNQKGFTLIEVIVVAGIIAILAGVLVPMIYGQIDESKKARAMADCKSISSAIMVFKKDVGRWPGMKDATNDFTLLYGPGYTVGTHDTQLAAIGGYITTDASPLSNHIVTNDPGYIPTKWNGPYMTDIQADPWGNPYVVNANGFFTIDPSTGVKTADASTAVWVLSAGPNGVFDTPYASSTIVAPNDDIGIRVK